MGYVTAQTPLITGAMSAYPYSKGLESLYTFTSTYDEQVCGAVRQGNTLWVPRESVPYAEETQDFRTTYPAKYLPYHFVPRNSEQDKLHKQSLKLLNAGQSHLFEAPTGWGKTVVGGAVAAGFGQPTLIVVTKEDLMHQWRESLTQVLKLPPDMVGQIQADVADWKGKQFVLGMVQSLMIEDKYPPELFRYFGLMVLDEVHHMAAECFVRVCQTFTAKSRLGFSATPTRKDGKTKLLHWHIGPTLCKGTILQAKPKIIVRQTGWKIPVRQNGFGMEEQIPHAPGRMTLVTKAMAASNIRNMEIVNAVVQSYNAGRTTLIMSDLREAHLDRLFQILTHEGIPGNDIGYYVGGMTKKELAFTKQRRVVLGTYAMCSTGTDVPKWDTLVMATPRADVKQAIGRVLRAVDGKKQPVIFDLVDHNSIFQGFHRARLKQYYSVGAEVVRV